MLNRDELKRQLADLSSDEMAQLVVEAQQERERQLAHKAASRSNDLLGTLRYYEGECGHDVIWARIAGWRWDPFPRETHGLSVADSELNWRDLVVVGQMPPSWIAEQEDYQRDYEADEA